MGTGASGDVRHMFMRRWVPEVGGREGHGLVGVGCVAAIERPRALMGRWTDARLAAKERPARGRARLRRGRKAWVMP